MRGSSCAPSAMPCLTSSSREPGRLREVTGIGPKRAERIVGGWAEQKVIREIMLFLHSNGVGTSRAVRIYKTYGAEAVQLIWQNPYRLARDIRGVGFRTADQIAAKLGIEKTALIRVRVGIAYALTETMDEGHLPRGLPASSGCGGHCAAPFGRGAKRNGKDRADEARPESAADRRARSHGLAAGIWLQLACPGGGRYRPLQASDR